MDIQEYVNRAKKDLDDVYNIGKSGSGKKFTTGTVTFTSAQNNQTITHNLGSIPSVFFMIAKNVQGEFTFNVENSPSAGIYGFYGIGGLIEARKYLVGENITGSNWNGYSLEWRNNNTTNLAWQSNTAGGGKADETTIKLTYRSAAYKYLANQEYEWIAIE